MPKIRDYASEETLTAALERELLNLETYTVVRDDETGRVRPVFTLHEGSQHVEELSTRLKAEGFEFEVVPAGNNATAAPDAAIATLATPGATPAEVVAISGHKATAGIAALAELAKASPRVIDPHVSDLFFNYHHGVYVAAMAEEDPDHKTAREAIRQDAEEFTTSVLGAFGIAINVDELVDDFFARL